MENFVRDGATTYFHQAGTCRMGKDSRAVVDAKLRVNGVQNLRIADSSIMPRIASVAAMANIPPLEQGKTVALGIGVGHFNGTASLASLLTQARPSLKGDVEQLNRVATLLDEDKATLDRGLQKGPDNYRKLARLGSYGSWIMYYICGISFRVTDLQGRTAVFPMLKQESGRCAEP